MNATIRGYVADSEESAIASRDLHGGFIEPKDWKIKNIDPKAIEAARKEAKRNGLMIGTWVAKVISEAAATGQSSGNNRPDLRLIDHNNSLNEQVQVMDKKIEEIGKKLTAIEDLNNSIKILTGAIVPIIERRA